MRPSPGARPTTGEALKSVDLKSADIVKWIAPPIRLVSNGLTGLNMTPWNVWFFFAEIVLWFPVGGMWKDRAVMVVPVEAFISLQAGYLNG